MMIKGKSFAPNKMLTDREIINQFCEGELQSIDWGQADRVDIRLFCEMQPLSPFTDYTSNFVGYTLRAHNDVTVIEGKVGYVGDTLARVRLLYREASNEVVLDSEYAVGGGGPGFAKTIGPFQYTLTDPRYKPELFDHVTKTEFKTDLIPNFQFGRHKDAVPVSELVRNIFRKFDAFHVNEDHPSLPRILIPCEKYAGAKRFLRDDSAATVIP
jgi:hypothetical protein